MVDDLVADGVAGAGALRHGVDHIDNYLWACQLGITVCSIGLGIAAEPLVSHLFEGLFGGTVFGIASTTVSFVLAYAVVSMFHVVLGELAPKSLAIARTRRTGLLLMPPMHVFYLATKPFVDLFNWMGNLVLKPFGIPPASEAVAEPHSEDELRSLIAESERRGLLGAEEEAFAHGAFTFGDRRAREILVPRHRVVILTTGQPLREAARQAACSGHRRLPLCEPDGGLDRPEGIINLSDLTRALAEDRQADLFELARPLLETSEATLLDHLLEELRERREHMALVRDEHGTALGILTMEDILEQVVGDIRDEFDPPREPPIEGSGDEFTVAGELSAHAVTRELGLELGDYQEGTIGGYVIERLGVVSVTGDEVEVGGLPTR